MFASISTRVRSFCQTVIGGVAAAVQSVKFAVANFSRTLHWLAANRAALRSHIQATCVASLYVASNVCVVSALVISYVVFPCMALYFVLSHPLVAAGVGVVAFGLFLMSSDSADSAVDPFGTAAVLVVGGAVVLYYSWAAVPAVVLAVIVYYSLPAIIMSLGLAILYAYYHNTTAPVCVDV